MTNEKLTSNKLKGTLIASLALGLAAPAAVFATNGMFLIANGTKSRGMGGVAIALTHDTLTSATNPATMAFTGNRFDIGGDIFVPAAEATLGQGATRATEESKPTHFTIADGVYMMPNMGASWDFGDMSLGFTMVGVGGGGSQYNFNLYNNTNPGADNNAKLGVSLLVMNINPTIAYKIDETHTVGATIMIGAQVFKSYGLGEFTTFTATGDSSAKFTNEGAEVTMGAGLRLGWLGKYTYNDMPLTLGAEFTSQTYMSEFEDYTDLFAEKKINTPGNIGIGAAYKVNEEWLVAMDINYIMYEDVPAIANIGPNTSGTPFPVDQATNALGLPNGLGFGWTNQTVFKIGAEYTLDENWKLRGGWNYAESPINEEREILFNIVAPATVEHHLTLGASWQYKTDIEFSFSYVHAFENEQFGPTQIGYQGGMSMEQDSIGATFSMNF